VLHCVAKRRIQTPMRGGRGAVRRYLQQTTLVYNGENALALALSEVEGRTGLKVRQKHERTEVWLLPQENAENTKIKLCVPCVLSWPLPLACASSFNSRRCQVEHKTPERRIPIPMLPSRYPHSALILPSPCPHPGLILASGTSQKHVKYGG
jgi:hypothetical protein